MRLLQAAVAVAFTIIALGGSAGTAQNPPAGRPDALPGIVGHVRNAS